MPQIARSLAPMRWTILVAILVAAAAPAAGQGYPWRPGAGETIEQRFAPPPGFARVAAAPGSFAAWLRGLPLRPPGTPVRLHDGRASPDQGSHAAVIDLDLPAGDLQQCADSIIRLRAEYLYAAGQADLIGFRFTSGDPARFDRWREGWRPRVDGRRVAWRQTAPPTAGRPALAAYLRIVFAYAGTASLAAEMAPVPLAAAGIGDALVDPGFPGHAVLLVDLARRPGDGALVALLAQGFMPAQDMHVLAGPLHGAWYPLPPGEAVSTPVWRFPADRLRRFRGPG